MLVVELFDSLHVGALRAAEYAEAQLARVALRNGPSHVARRLEFFQHGQGVRIVRPSCAREDDLLMRAVEQLESELLLERLNLLADGRLRDVQLLSGLREAAMARDRCEAFQLRGSHGASVS